MKLLEFKTNDSLHHSNVSHVSQSHTLSELAANEFLSINYYNEYVPLFAVRPYNSQFDLNYIKLNSISSVEKFINSIPTTKELLSNSYINKFIHSKIAYDGGASPRESKTRYFFSLNPHEEQYMFLMYIKSKFNVNGTDKLLYYRTDLGYLGQCSKEGILQNSIYCLMVHRKAIPFITMSTTINHGIFSSKVPIDAVKMVALKDMESSNPHAYSYYNKLAVKFCTEKGIRIEETDNFAQYFNIFTPPVIKSIAESKETLKKEASIRLLCQL